MTTATAAANLKAEAENAAYGTAYVVSAAAFSVTVMAAVTAAGTERALRRRRPKASQTSTGK